MRINERATWENVSYWDPEILDYRTSEQEYIVIGDVRGSITRDEWIGASAEIAEFSLYLTKDGTVVWDVERYESGLRND